MSSVSQCLHCGALARRLCLLREAASQTLPPAQWHPFSQPHDVRDFGQRLTGASDVTSVLSQSVGP